MFCPKCKDEYRPGFTRCAICGVDLVDDLAAVRDAPAADSAASLGATRERRDLLRMRDYCGFLSLDEARRARDVLHSVDIASEIAIRVSPDSPPTGPVVEEYWLRVEQDGFKSAIQQLGFDEAEAEPGDDEEETSECSACGSMVGAEEPFCPRCGATFEDD